MNKFCVICCFVHRSVPFLSVLLQAQQQVPLPRNEDSSGRVYSRVDQSAAAECVEEHATHNSARFELGREGHHILGQPDEQTARIQVLLLSC